MNRETMESSEPAQDAAADVAVAVGVMGWKPFPYTMPAGFRGAVPPGCQHSECVPRYTTDPAADYEVLKRVRETWTDERKVKFGSVIWDVWMERYYMVRASEKPVGLLYLPGDYSRAALAVIDGESEGGK